MPEYAVSYWENVLKEMAQTKEWRETCDRYGWTMDYEGREDFTVFLDEVSREYAVLLYEIGMLKE